MVTANELALYREDADMKELELAFQMFEYAQNKYQYTESMIQNKTKLNMQMANMKVIQESGTIDDVVLLTNAALNEAGEQQDANKKNLWQKFKEFLTSVWNAIQKIFTGKDTEAFQKMQEANEKVTFNCKVEEVLGAAENAVNVVNNNKGKVAAIGAGLGTLVVSGLGIKAFFDKKKEANNETTTADAKQCEGFWNRLKNIFSGFAGMKDAQDPEPGNADAEKAPSIVSSILSFLKEKIQNPIMNALSKFKNKNNGDQNNNNDQNGNDQNADQNANNNGGNDQQQAQTQQNNNNDQNANNNGGNQNQDQNQNNA